MFNVIDYFYRLVGNFGLAILIVTVLIKVAFFPLANKSYAWILASRPRNLAGAGVPHFAGLRSMAKMKAVQPQMQAPRELSRQ